MSVFCALEARVPPVGPVLGRLVNRVERMHPRVAAHAYSPAVGGPIACQRLLLQHLQRRTVATTAAQLCSQTHSTTRPRRCIHTRQESPSDCQEKVQATPTLQHVIDGAFCAYVTTTTKHLHALHFQNAEVRLSGCTRVSVSKKQKQRKKENQTKQHKDNALCCHHACVSQVANIYAHISIKVFGIFFLISEVKIASLTSLSRLLLLATSQQDVSQNHNSVRKLCACFNMLQLVLTYSNEQQLEQQLLRAAFTALT